jgi:diguanylate cyclase (GGDEF)-like protein
MGNSPGKNILLIANDPEQARLIPAMFNDQGSCAFELTCAERMSEAEEYLAGHSVDIVLLDLGLTDPEGLEAVRRIRAAAPRASIVLLASLDDEPVAIQAMHEGAQGYLIKSQIEPQQLMQALSNPVERVLRDVNAAPPHPVQADHPAMHDVLTGLPNRLLLNDRVGQAISLARRHRGHAAVLFLVLDGFKQINDSLGHPAGDKLLQSVARCLLACVRTPDTVSRQQGDEFVVLLQDVKQPEDAATAATRMLEELAKVHSVDHHELRISASIGVSVYPDDGLDALTLIENANAAMHQAKKNRRHSYQFYIRETNDCALRNQSIEQGLRLALERNELTLHYQPKIDLRTGTISGAEALSRWIHPTQGSIPAGQFIPVAEESGLILPIGAWVLREACMQVRAWVNAGMPVKAIAVNVSGTQFQNEDFLGELFAILDATGLDPEFLELDVTENVLMKHPEHTAFILKCLRNTGVQVSVDNFGASNSSLRSLQKLPLDAVKIDRSFVRQITTVPDGATTMGAIIGMGRRLNLRVVAQGVETAEDLEFLWEHDCDEAQGNFFSRPVPPEQLASWFHAQ